MQNSCFLSHCHKFKLITTLLLYRLSLDSKHDLMNDVSQYIIGFLRNDQAHIIHYNERALVPTSV